MMKVKYSRCRSHRCLAGGYSRRGLGPGHLASSLPIRSPKMIAPSRAMAFIRSPRRRGRAESAADCCKHPCSFSIDHPFKLRHAQFRANVAYACAFGPKANCWETKPPTLSDWGPRGGQSLTANPNVAYGRWCPASAHTVFPPAAAPISSPGSVPNTAIVPTADDYVSARADRHSATRPDYCGASTRTDIDATLVHRLHVRAGSGSHGLRY